MPFGIQPWHLIVIVIVALVIFGPSRLPKLGRSIGNFFRDLRAGARDMTSGLKKGLEEPESENVTAQRAEASGEAASSPGGAAAESGAAASPSAGNFCNYCGKPNPAAAKYCNSCGKPVRG